MLAIKILLYSAALMLGLYGVFKLKDYLQDLDAADDYDKKHERIEDER